MAHDTIVIVQATQDYTKTAFNNSHSKLKFDQRYKIDEFTDVQAKMANGDVIVNGYWIAKQDFIWVN